MMKTNPKDFSKVEDSQKLEFFEFLKEEFWIEAKEISVTVFPSMQEYAKTGFVLTPTARGNAWICSLCWKCFYANPMEAPTEHGIHYDDCKYKDHDEAEEMLHYQACDCHGKTVPLTMWATEEENGIKEVHAQIDICHECQEEHQIIEKMIAGQQQAIPQVDTDPFLASVFVDEESIDPLFTPPDKDKLKQKVERFALVDLEMIEKEYPDYHRILTAKYQWGDRSVNFTEYVALSLEVTSPRWFDCPKAWNDYFVNKNISDEAVQLEMWDTSVMAIPMVACQFCPFGHMLDCHFPHNCDSEHCNRNYEE